MGVAPGQGSGGPCAVMSKLNKFKHVGGGGPCMVRSNTSCIMVTWGPPVSKHTYMTENITFPQLCYPEVCGTGLWKYSRFSNWVYILTLTQVETQTETEVHKIYAMLVVLVFDDFGDTTKFCENLLSD